MKTEQEWEAEAASWCRRLFEAETMQQASAVRREMGTWSRELVSALGEERAFAAIDRAKAPVVEEFGGTPRYVQAVLKGEPI